MLDRTRVSVWDLMTGLMTAVYITPGIDHETNKKGWTRATYRT